jgi:hypothetical protein
MFYTDLNFISIAMFVFGGASSVTGAVAGVVVITPVTEILRDGVAGVQLGSTTSSSSGPAADHSAATFLRPSARCKHARDARSAAVARSRDLHDLNATRQNARQAQRLPPACRLRHGVCPTP